ncbi:MAG: hypothetical protein IT319_01860 [Anaerolineae bacterium]|nr:hypothetical protein [Anaerolineae bacterium]
MSQPIGHEAAIPNPSLEPFRVLIGTWDTVGTHPLVPGVTLHGRSSFEWIEGGAFLIMRSEILDDARFPSGIAVFGHDDDQEGCAMVYFDQRGVSRIIQTTLSGNVWKTWRNAPGFSQRFTGTISEDGNTIVGMGELSRDGSTWEGDLSLTYTKVKS